MLCSNILGTTQRTLYNHLERPLPETTELYLALANSDGSIQKETVRRFRVNLGYYRCISTLTDLQCNGGLLSGRFVAQKEFAAIRSGYAATGFKMIDSIPVVSASYLVLSAKEPADVPGALLQKTKQTEPNPFYQDKDTYLESIGLGPENEDVYFNNHLVSDAETAVPSMAIGDGCVVSAVPFCTVCRVCVKTTSHGQIVGLCIKFKQK